MTRANRQYIPGCFWHITDRCHKQEFLLKFNKDLKTLRFWLYEARKRYGISILNYAITRNHIHLLVIDVGARHVIPRAIQLAAGQTARAYNRRKKRRGAFWEDNYHATAVESGLHLHRCMVYIDMNMVRAGAVRHPEEWPFGGYYEIQHPRGRYKIVDYHRLMSTFGFKDISDLQDYRSATIAVALRRNSKYRKRDENWTQSVAIGSKAFVESAKERLGIDAKGRVIKEIDGGFVIRERPATQYV